MKKLFIGLLCVLLLFGVACSTPKTDDTEKTPQTNGETETTEKTIEFNAGTYTGVGTGIGGDCQIDVTFSENKITDISLKDMMDTQYIFMQAFDSIKESVIGGQTLNVDSVSGATFSSKGIITAIKDSVIQAGGDVELLANNPPYDKPETEFVSDADVVIVGSGMTGMVAAASAVETGAKVVVLEKLDIIGGSSATAAGGIAGDPYPENTHYFGEHLKALADYFPTVSEIDEKKIDRTGEALTESHQWLEKLFDNFNYKLTYYSKVAGLSYYGDLISDKGWQWSTAVFTPYEKYHGGDYEIKMLRDSFEEKGGIIYTGTPATKLLVDDNGAIKGIEAVNEGKTITINTPSVILACGGAAWDTDLLVEIDREDITISCIGNTGDAIKLGSEIGAAVYDDQHIMGCPGRIYPLDLYNDVFMSQTPVTGIYVDDSGSRRVAETFSNYSVHASFFQEGRDHYWAIYNEDLLANSTFNYGAADLKGKSMLEIVDSRLDTFSDYYVKADTLEELAQKLEMENLVYTMNKYNEDCKVGKDSQFPKLPDSLIAMDEGPYYAIYAELIGIGTVGGVISDEDCQVLNTEGNVIPGLYAAGEASNHAYFNVSYQGSFALGISLSAGRIAGLNAAEFSLK